MKLFERYDDSLRPPAPVVTVVVTNPVNDLRAEVKAYVDTGFSETLLLPEEYYDKLSLMLTEFDEDSYAVHGGFFPARL